MRTLSLAATVANLAGEYDRANALLDEAARLGTEAVDVQREAEIPIGGRLVVATGEPGSRHRARGHHDHRRIRDRRHDIRDAAHHRCQGAPRAVAVRTLGVADRSADVFGVTLRRDVHFSDGTPLTAAAVKLSIETSSRLPQTCPRRSLRSPEGGVPRWRPRAYRRSRRSGDIGPADQPRRAAADLPALLTEGSTAVVSRARPRQGSRA